MDKSVQMRQIQRRKEKELIEAKARDRLDFLARIGHNGVIKESASKDRTKERNNRDRDSEPQDQDEPY